MTAARASVPTARQRPGHRPPRPRHWDPAQGDGVGSPAGGALLLGSLFHDRPRGPGRRPTRGGRPADRPATGCRSMLAGRGRTAQHQDAVEPARAAAAAVWRQWFDWIAPTVSTRSARWPARRRSAAPAAGLVAAAGRPVWSSRFIHRRGPPSAAVSRSSAPNGVGRWARESGRDGFMLSTPKNLPQAPSLREGCG